VLAADNKGVAEVQRALCAILAPDQVVEVRCPNVRGHVVSGYFNQPDTLAQAVGAITRAAGIYITANPVKPELLARAANRVRELGKGESTTSDADILSRRWLLIDCDPERPAGISSTDSEHDASLAVAETLAASLMSEGWPAPIIADSGNGGHLMWRIDLPTDDGGMVKKCLEALAFRFNTNAVHIDTTVHNPARIWKLYGTIARKGDSTPDRPHRQSMVLGVPSPLEVVTTEQLSALIVTLPTMPVTPAGRPIAGLSQFDLDAWMFKHLPDADTPVAWQGGRIWKMPICPFNPDHNDRSSYVVQAPSGAIGFGCHHNGCQGKRWQDLRELLEPGCYDRKATLAETRPLIAPTQPASNGKQKSGADWVPEMPKVWTPDELLVTEFPDPKWAVPNLIPEGLTILAGAPKQGKSWLCYNLTLAIASGGVAVGSIPVEPGEVLYLSLEDTPRRLKARLKKLTHDWPQFKMPRAQIVTSWPRIGHGGLKLLKFWLGAHPECRLVIIDTLQKIRNEQSGQGRNAYEEDYGVASAIKQVADEFGIAILVVHHLRKMTSDDIYERVSGSNGLTGAADGVMIIKRERGKADAVLFASGRDVEETELAIKFDPANATWSLIGDAAVFRQSTERQAIARILKETQRAMDPTEVSQLIPGSKPANVKRLLYLMHDEGKGARSVGGGRFIAPSDGTVISNPLENPFTDVHSFTRSEGVAVNAVKPSERVNAVNGSERVPQSVMHLPDGPIDCLDCGNPLPEGWMFRCPLCLEKIEQRIDPD
jgi:hypothetical protein